MFNVIWLTPVKSWKMTVPLMLYGVYNFIFPREKLYRLKIMFDSSSLRLGPDLLTRTYLMILHHSARWQGPHLGVWGHPNESLWRSDSWGLNMIRCECRVGGPKLGGNAIGPALKARQSRALLKRGLISVIIIIYCVIFTNFITCEETDGGRERN